MPSPWTNGVYADLVLAALPAATRHHLGALMSTGTYEYQSDFARRYFSPHAQTSTSSKRGLGEQ